MTNYSKKISLLLALLCLTAGTSANAGDLGGQVAPGATISVRDFGAVPNDETNDAPALRKALEFAKSHPGIVLHFPPGIYNWHDDSAVRLMDRAMNGEFGPNPEATIFKAYFPYARGLDFRGISGLTIEARGATLLCEGWMEPVSLDQAHDITIRGLTIDYKRRAYSAGPVVAVGNGYFDAVIEDQYPITPRMPVPRVMFWDPKAHRMIGDPGVQRFEVIAPQTVRVYINDPILSRVAGSQAGLMHSMHFRPAILIQQADNIRLEGVTIHSQPGMGIVGHHSSNITLSGLRIVPASGSFFSTTTDATHFTSLKGLLRIENSEFVATGDDGTNVHGYYYSIAKSKAKGRYDLTLPMNTHAAVLDYPDVGDSLDVVNAGTLEPVGSVVVESVSVRPDQMRTEVELEGNLPQDLTRILLANTTRVPRLEIVGSKFWSMRSRGVLIKTRNVLIERNLFFDITGTAIHVAAEGGWREGIPSSNVVIRDNRIIGGGFGGGTIDGASAITVNIASDAKSTARLHHGLLIENNIIDGAGAGKCISVSQAEDVEVRYNEFSRCHTPITTRDTGNVNIHDNTTVPTPGAGKPNSAIVPVPQPGMEKRHAEKAALAAQHRYDLLMIGDSITHGLEGPDYRAVWQQFYAPRNTLNLGYGGARTENILWNLTHGELDNQSPKVVTLLIGTNNSDDANYPVVSTAEQIAEGTAAIVNLLRDKFPDTKILLLRIFPRTNVYKRPDGSERGSAQQRSATNQRAGELAGSLADGKHVFYLDINRAFLRPDGSIDPQLMPDLLHPSPAGALVWARAMEPTLARLFGDLPRNPASTQ